MIFSVQGGWRLGQLRGFTTTRRMSAEPGLGIENGEKSSVWYKPSWSFLCDSQVLVLYKQADGYTILVLNERSESHQLECKSNNGG